jgi:hypothetical protein
MGLSAVPGLGEPRFIVLSTGADGRAYVVLVGKGTISIRRHLTGAGADGR